MPMAHVLELDLNLLKALDALLAEGSVTRAAARVGLTQPAMSRALGRLREALGDPLLVRAGRALVPTPRAVVLRPRLRAALEQLDAAVADPAPFAPARERRVFHLATADYGMAVLVPALLARLAVEAPGVSVSVQPQAPGQDEALADGRLDVLVAPRRASGPGLVWTRLFTEDFVALVGARGPRSLSLAQYCERGHVFVSPALQHTGVVDEVLAREGRSRRIAVRVPSFLVAPLITAQSELVSTVPRRVAVQAVAQLPVRLLPLPVAVPGFTVCLAWHERARHDEGHVWFRRLVAEVAQGLR